MVILLGYILGRSLLVAGEALFGLGLLSTLHSKSILHWLVTLWIDLPETDINLIILFLLLRIPIILLCRLVLLVVKPIVVLPILLGLRLLGVLLLLLVAVA
jgi:hypothetical protein